MRIAPTAWTTPKPRRMRIMRRVSPPPRFLSRDVGDPARIGGSARTSSFTVFPFSFSRELGRDRAGCLARGAVADPGRRIRNGMGDGITGSAIGLAIEGCLAYRGEGDRQRQEPAIERGQSKFPYCDKSPFLVV